MNINPRQLAQAMKKMGVAQEDIPAELVTIKLAGSDKELHILEPSVARVRMAGQESFQITGTVVEKRREVSISEEDITTVVQQTGASREVSLEGIRKHHGDLASAILELKR